MQENFKKAIEYLDKAVSLGFAPHPKNLMKLDVYRNA